MRFHFRGAVSAGEPVLAVVICLRRFQQARNRLEPIAATGEALDTASLELLCQHLLDLNGFGFAAIALDETKSDRGSDNPGPGEFVIHCNFPAFYRTNLQRRRAGFGGAGRTALREQGLISYGRGQILVRNRQGMERMAGEAYGTPEAEYRRLFG